MFAIVLPAIVQGFLSYEDQDNWGGHCQEDHQQSPITIESNSIAISGAGYADISFPNQVFEYSATLKILIDDHLECALDYNSDETADSLSRITLDQDDADGTTSKESFDLKSVHFHFGGTEHIVDQYESDGTAHFVHKSEDGSIAVIGLPFLFDDNSTIDLGFIAPDTCPNGKTISTDLCGSKEAGKWDPIHWGGQDATPYKEHNGPIYTLLGYPAELSFDDFINYTGSLTTPGCDGGVRWLVYRNEPVKVKTIPGWETFTMAIPNSDTSIEFGNIRSPQVLLSNTTVALFDGDVRPEGKGDSAVARFTTVFLAMAAIAFLI